MQFTQNQQDNEQTNRLPFFAFEPTKYLYGNASFTCLAAQGLFVRIACWYWLRECKMTSLELRKRVSQDEEQLLQELIDQDVVKESIDGTIQIRFLDQERTRLLDRYKKRRAAGSKGGKQRATNAQALLEQNSSNREATSSNKNRKDERRGDRMDPQVNPPSIEEFLEHSKLKCTQLGFDFQKLQSALVAKFEAWTDSGWRRNDEDQTEIRNWKSTLTNSLAHIHDRIANRPDSASPSLRNSSLMIS